jgi:hypothetical protein
VVYCQERALQNVEELFGKARKPNEEGSHYQGIHGHQGKEEGSLGSLGRSGNGQKRHEGGQVEG